VEESTNKENSMGSEQTKNHRKSNRYKILAVLILLILILSGIYWFLFKRNRVSTDDAYVMADSARISSRVPGTAERVLVENDQVVKAGDTLVVLDPRDYQVMVDKARASLKEVESKVKASEVSISLVDNQTEANMNASKATFRGAKDREREVRHRLEELTKKRLSALADFKHAKKDFKRFENLYKGGASSERQRDKTHTAFKKARAQLAAVDAEIAAAKASIDAVAQGVKKSEAQLLAAKSDRDKVKVQKYNLSAMKAKRGELKAKLEAAQLNLSYCTIKAPIAGYISQKNIQVGDHVQPGVPFMAVVPLSEVYVEANFKETQLENVRIGQPAKIHADIYPGYAYRGRVVGIRAGTGAAFSLLPPENATGNWIKVVQRIPVKIELESPPPRDHPLRVGLSLEVTIDTSNKSGRNLAAEMPH